MRNERSSGGVGGVSFLRPIGNKNIRAAESFPSTQPITRYPDVVKYLFLLCQKVTETKAFFFQGF